nr:hypothetical protein [Tanacetum cinerariifolium]
MLQSQRGIIEIGEELRADKSTELGSNDTEEMVNVLNSMEAANILTSRGAAASVSLGYVLLTVGVPTVSGSFPNVSAIFTTASVFIHVWKQIEDFVPMSSKEEAERVKMKGLKLDQGSAKKMKTSKDVSKEDLKRMMQLVHVEEVYVEALQVKHLIID